MAENTYLGLLMIGDPHLEGRQPGFRKDNYPEVILDKLAWCLDYAQQNRLLPVILGDLFDKPRDNPNWMIVRLLDLMNREVVGLYGNHDCADPVLGPHDSLSLLVTSGRLRLLTAESPWCGVMGGRTVIIGGSSYRQPIPERFACDRQDIVGSPLVIWLTHHDLRFPVRRRRLCRASCELMSSSTAHPPTPATVEKGQTRWLTPVISLPHAEDVARPRAVSAAGSTLATNYELAYIEVPHQALTMCFTRRKQNGPRRAPVGFHRGLGGLQAAAQPARRPRNF
jgi:hypothetical protein